MRQYFILYVFLLALLKVSAAQSLRRPVSAIYPGLATYSNLQPDVFSFVNNQAALAQVVNTGGGVYVERRFLLQATSLYTAAFALPTSRGNVGINLKYSGFKYFHEEEMGLAYARRLGSKLDLGIQFNYYSLQVPGYSNTNAVSFELGAIAHLTNSLNLGLHVYNPAGGQFLKTDEKLICAYKAGLGYDASDLLFLSTELVKEEQSPLLVYVGIQYRPVKQLFARVGISSASSTVSAGVGISWDNLRLDITGSYHPQLGFSPGLLLILQEKKGTVPAIAFIDTPAYNY